MNKIRFTEIIQYIFIALTLFTLIAPGISTLCFLGVFLSFRIYWYNAILRKHNLDINKLRNE